RLVNWPIAGIVRKAGFYSPPDPASQRASGLGGNIGENSGGPHCFKYGVTTNYVTGLEVVLANGEIIQFGGPALDYPEYDFCGAMVGSEGTLGIFTKAFVRFIPDPPGVRTMMVAFPSLEAAGNAVSAVIAAGLTPATLEMMDQKIMGIIEEYSNAGLPVNAGAGLIVEVDGYVEGLDSQVEEIADIMTNNGGFDLRIAQSEAERTQIWYGRKSVAGAFARLSPNTYLVDVTVPRSRLADMLTAVDEVCARHNVQAGHVFHAGDGNLHPVIMCDARDEELMGRVFAACDEIIELCVDRKGSITGEHGVGIEKRRFMPAMYSGSELAAMLDLKAIFDPDNLLNPGKIFPDNLPAPTYAAPEPPTTTPFAPTTATEAAAAFVALGQQGQNVRITSQTEPTDATAPTPLTTRNLSGIQEFAPADLYVTVGAGTTVAELTDFLREHKLQTALVSPWPDATVGSLLSTNVNSPQRTRYGALRDSLLSTTVALADGRVIQAGRVVVKNVAGYDLPKLFVGSQGTLGLMTDATLKLYPLPRAQ
ncbi:MAG: FAD-binding protein, partial [Caldilineaceae bacterium]|nr:FAD-binding protein [Caldilineaceae bacterium]